MYRFILKRIGLLIPTLFGVITLVFFMLALSPGDSVRVMLGDLANKESVEELKAEMGLDRLMSEQYVLYLKRIVKLNFGKSIKSGQSVVDEISTRFPAAIELTLFAMMFAIVLDVFIGVISATKKYSFVDYALMFGALSGVSMPVFCRL